MSPWSFQKGLKKMSLFKKKVPLPACNGTREMLPFLQVGMGKKTNGTKTRLKLSMQIINSLAPHPAARAKI